MHYVSIELCFGKVFLVVIALILDLPANIMHYLHIIITLIMNKMLYD